MTEIRWRGLATVIAIVAVLAGATACGGAGRAATGSSPGSATAYLSCMQRHLGNAGSAGGSEPGPRQACKSLRPAGGLRAALRPFAACLHAHGVNLPGLAGSSPPVSSQPGSSPTGGRGRELLQFVGGLRSGSPSQRQAYAACKSKL